MMNFLKKLDYWINYCFKNDGWLGIFTGFIFATALLAVSFKLPLSMFQSVYMFLLIGFIYFALVVGAIRLIKKRKIKKLADERMDAEISARKAEKSINKRDTEQKLEQ